MYIKLLLIAIFACTNVLAQGLSAGGMNSGADAGFAPQSPRTTSDWRNTYIDMSLNLNEFSDGGSINCGIHFSGTYYLGDFGGISAVVDLMSGGGYSINSIGVAVNAKYPIMADIYAYALGGLSYVYDGGDYPNDPKVDSTTGLFFEAGARYLLQEFYVKASLRYLSASSDAGGENISLNNTAIMAGVGVRF